MWQPNLFFNSITALMFLAILIWSTTEKVGFFLQTKIRFCACFSGIFITQNWFYRCLKNTSLKNFEGNLNKQADQLGISLLLKYLIRFTPPCDFCPDFLWHYFVWNSRWQLVFTCWKKWKSKHSLLNKLTGPRNHEFLN